MRRRWIAPTALLATAVALGPVTGAPAKANKQVKVGCALALTALGPPQGTPPVGNSFGFVQCDSPLGNGVHYGSATVTPTSPGNGTIAVTFKNYYDRGTVNGKIAGTFTAASPADITYAGKVTFTGGTGTFKHVRGTGAIRCTTSDAGAHKACTVTSKLTGT
jgi:hypothetical protein